MSERVEDLNVKAHFTHTLEVRGKSEARVAQLTYLSFHSITGYNLFLITILNVFLEGRSQQIIEPVMVVAVLECVFIAKSNVN